MTEWRVASSCTAAFVAVSTTMIVAHAAQAPQARPTGVIVGTVTDATGQPLVGARVQAVLRRKRWAGPYYETPVGSPDDSDDRGQFRLHSLPSGSYVVAVSITEKPPLPVESGYMRTYNPGTISLADARPIVVRAGAEQSTSIRFAPVRFMFINGVARTSEGQPAANFDVWLRGGPATIGYTGVHGGYMTTMVTSTRAAQDGSFSLARVPPGVYTLMVTNGQTRNGRPLEIVEVPLEVRNASINDLKVNTARGATVSGRLEWAGGGPVPWPRDGQRLGMLRAAAVGRETDFASLDSEIQGDGTFRFTNLYGLRRIQAMTLSFNWTIQSVEGPKEIVSASTLDIKPGRDVTDLRVVVTGRSGTLAATVSDEDGKPFLTGSVLLMPRNPAELDPLGWGFRATQRNRGVGDVWYYTMERILPGTYLAVAIDVEPYRLTGDADLMERARAAAVPVQIREGETRLPLRVLRLRPFVVGP
jgi:carboxypeptidase family protein